MPTILHASDLQAGRPYRPEAAEALLTLAEELAPDVIVISGDLTQRAKAREFRKVRSLLDRLPPAPVVLVPGNHDVPLFRLWERLLDPYRGWRRFNGPDQDTVTRASGLTIVALDSSAPRRAIVNGRIDPGQVAFARESFAGAPAQDARVLVVHHHLVPTRGNVGGEPLPRAAELLGAFEEMGVELVLGGHIHHTRVILSGGDDGSRGVPLVSSGTTTSSRGRGNEQGLNSLTVVRLAEQTIEVVPHLREGRRFIARDPMTFTRRSRRAPSHAGTSEGASS